VSELPIAARDQSPLILIVPGLNDSGSDHWQSVWERQRSDCVRVDLGMWDRPHRNTWVNKLNLAIHRANRPVILVAHSLGCHAVAWWAHYEQPLRGGPVLGALLVAPPDVEAVARDHPIAPFAPVPDIILPFETIVVASHDDHYIAYERARALAQLWGAQFADAGRAGHINADSRLGDWPFGQFLLSQLVARVTGRSAVPSRPIDPAPLLPRVPSLRNPAG
jgi:uncharacterized protein